MDIRLIDANALDDQLGVSDRDIYVKDCLNEQPAITLNDLRDEIYADAVAHGLWEWTESYCYLPDLRSNCSDLVNGEALELEAECDDEEKYSEELADVIITCFSAAGRLGIDIDAAIRRKMEINKGRPWKHGKE